MLGHMISSTLPQFERISSDFQIGPSQLAEMPRSAVETYSLVASALSTFGSTLMLLKEYANGGAEQLVSPQTLYTCWAAFDFLAKNAEKLRMELVVHAKVDEKEAEELLTRQRADFTSHVPLILSSKEHLEAATSALKPIMDAQLAMVLAMAKMVAEASSGDASADAEDPPSCP
jgi:hypothetical protein